MTERRRYLSMAKLSLLAAGTPSNADEIVSIDAALDLTSIQIGLSRRRRLKKLLTTSTTGVGGGGGGSEMDSEDPTEDEAPLPPLRLVEACLEGGGGGGGTGATAAAADDDETQDILDSFAVFASSGGAFREANKSLLVNSWRKAVSATDWEMLKELRGSGSDAAYVRALSATPVARAARRCYDASFAVRLGPPFEEVMTPRDVLMLLEEALVFGGGDDGGKGDAGILDPVREALGLYVHWDGGDEDKMA